MCMENQIQLFTNQLFGNVRSIMINGEPYFCLNDVMNCLGLNPEYSKDVRKRLDEFIELSNNNYQTPGGLVTTPGSNSNILYTYTPIQVQTGTKSDGSPALQTVSTLFISEPALYYVIFQSRKPQAMLFQLWVYKEVLPSMRKIGFDKSMQLLQEENAKLKHQIEVYNALSDNGVIVNI